jgi:hypothetical protein
MIILVPDVNAEGHFYVMVNFLKSDEWRYLWDELRITVSTFTDLGLKPDSTDLEVWHRTQEVGAILVTANRNYKTSDSLEAAIRLHNHVAAMPIITLSDSRRRDRQYYENAAIKMLDHLINLDLVRGAGRIYIP